MEHITLHKVVSVLCQQSEIEIGTNDPFGKHMLIAAWGLWWKGSRVALWHWEWIHLLGPWFGPPQKFFIILIAILWSSFPKIWLEFLLLLHETFQILPNFSFTSTKTKDFCALDCINWRTSLNSNHGKDVPVFGKSFARGSTPCLYQLEALRMIPCIPSDTGQRGFSFDLSKILYVSVCLSLSPGKQMDPWLIEEKCLVRTILDDINSYQRHWWYLTLSEHMTSR